MLFFQCSTYIYMYRVSQKKWWLVFFLDKKLKIPIYGNFDARSPNSGSKTVPEGYFAKKSRNHSITDFPIFEDLCGWKKNWKVTWKNGQFCPKHQFWYFPSKTKYESPFSQFFGFFTCLVRFQQYLKTGNIEGNFVFGLFKSSGYEQSLKKRWKLAQTQILIFSLKNNIWKHIFSIFHIWVVSQNTLCMSIEITVFS